MDEHIKPQDTYALIVGVERYEPSLAAEPLDGPVRDALGFVEWLNSRNVPATNIFLFLSPLQENTPLLNELGQVVYSDIPEAKRENIGHASPRSCQRRPASCYSSFGQGTVPL